jgi:SAM-dependent methyltransferase
MPDHRVFAAIYDPLSRAVDRAGMAQMRSRLISEAAGRVLEIGAGTGLNLPHYRDVDEVVLLEPDGAMRRRLEPRLASATVPVDVRSEALEDADFPDASFDTVVATLVFCSVASLPAALARVRRLLKPDGRLLFLEHIAATGGRLLVQRIATPAWTRIAAGCHLDRDTLTAIREAGFLITDCERHHRSLDPFTGVLVEGIARPRAQEEAA